jgi:hypothetical protein
MEDRDEVIERAVAQLRMLPDVHDDAKARVLIAVAAERERDRAGAASRQRWSRRMRWITSGAAVAAALLAAVYLRTQPVAGTPDVASSTHANAPVAPSAPAAQLASGDAAALEMAAQPVQFVLRAPDAVTVHVVGDFNEWDKEQAAMVRDSASGLWSATLMVRPGRHVYAFVVNDSIWRRDPRAAAAPDADFGRPGSVLLVTRPALPATR